MNDSTNRKFDLHSLDDSSAPPTLELVTPIAPALKLSARWVQDLTELESITAQWIELSSQSVSKNPAFEPGFLIPAFTHLNDCNARCLIIEDITDSSKIRLLGLLPLVEQQVFGIPLKSVSIWAHDYCFDSTPLIHREHVDEVIAGVFKFLATENYSVLSIPKIVAESELNQSLYDNLKLFQGASFTINAYERAAFEAAANSEQYILDNLSKKLRQKSQRLARRLAEQGQICYEPSDEKSDFSTLAQQFLDLEHSGWKGRNSTSMASQPESEKFYKDCINRLSPNGQSRFLTLKIDGKPIAMSSCICSGSYVQAFKTAFDESYSEYSPGVAIEIENIKLMHADGIAFADSCAATSNSAMNRIWGQTVQVKSLVLSLRRGMPTVIVKSLPLVKGTRTKATQIQAKLRSFVKLEP